jgi:hypothetical protein
MPTSTPATRDYQRAQVALRALTYKDITRLWALLDVEKLDKTFPVFAAATLQVIRQRRDASASFAKSYLEALRRGVEGEPPKVAAPGLVTGDVLRDLRFASVVSIKTAMTRGRSLKLASRNALVRTMGVADRYINDGGRELIRASIEADPAAKGWVRVTLGTCDYCAEKAKGEHMHRAEADFPRHDHCGCVPEPQYENAITPEPEYVEKLANILRAGDATPEQLRAAVANASELGKANAEEAIRVYLAEQEAAAAQAAAQEAAREALAATRSSADAFLTRGQYDALTPTRAWSEEKRAEILSTLRETDEGKILADTLERFQDGGSIARLRTKIDQYLAGVEIDATSRSRAEALLNAIRNAPEDWAPDTLYRGMTVKGKLENVLAKYTPGGEPLDFNLTSFTSDRNVAKRFQQMTSKGSGNETRVMVELIGDGKRALPIQNLPRDSRLFKEKEWVSAGRYEIVEAKKSSGSVLLRIRQVGTP